MLALCCSEAEECTLFSPVKLAQLMQLVCRPFHQLRSPEVEVFLTTNRGWGVKAAEPIQKGSFIVEYAGKSTAFKAHIPASTADVYGSLCTSACRYTIFRKTKFNFTAKLTF